MPTRRQFLGVSAATVAGAALSTWPDPVRAAVLTPRRNLVLLHASGGWDVTYALDPKPGISSIDAPAGKVEMFGDLPIFTDASRPGVGAFFEAYGAQAAVINGIDSRSIVHPTCLRRMVTGSASDSSPDLGAIAGYELGRDLPAPCLVLNSVAHPGAYGAVCVQMGFTKQLKALLDPKDAYPTETLVLDTDDEAAVRRCVAARVERQRAVRGSGKFNQTRLDEFLASRDAGDLLARSSAELGPRGVALSTADQLSLAADAIQKGLSFAVLAGDHPGIYEWDTHSDNSPQNGYFDDLFQTLRDFADDLASRPGKASGSKMLDETVVVVLSELGRTPKLNDQGGKDHWPFTSALVFGAGVAGGRAYGGTDDDLGGKLVDLTTGAPDDGGVRILADHLVAGVLELIGVDPSAYTPGVDALRGFIA